MRTIVIEAIPELKGIYNALVKKISEEYTIREEKTSNISLYINLDINYNTGISRSVFSSKNREYERYFKDKFPGGVAIINYSYLDTKEYPTVGIELNYEYAISEKGIDLVSNSIINAIYEHDKN